MSTFIFPSPSSPPATEVKKQPLYKKTELPVKIEPPTKLEDTLKEPENAPKPTPVETSKVPVQYTHILSVLIQHNVVPSKPVAEINREILKEVAKVIHNVVHTKMLGNNITVPVAWVQQGSIYSNKYFTNSELFGDVAIKKHTALLLKDVLEHIDAIFDGAFSQKKSVLIFDLTKPLTKRVVLI